MSKTKRSLIFSVLAVALCLVMLIGATFAWFTDNASTGVNKIQAGTLDIDLVDMQGNSLEGEFLDWVAKDGRAQSEILWEPGCTYTTEPFIVRNNSDLAIECRMMVNSFTGDMELLDVIDYALYQYDVTTGEVIESEPVPTSSFVLYPNMGQTGDVMAVVLQARMSKDAGNEYQGMKLNGAGIVLQAKQYTSEFDSFDNQYDATAEYDKVPTVYIPSVEIPADTTLDGTTSTKPTLTGNMVITAEDNTLTLGNNTSIGEETAINMGGTTQKVENSIKAEGGQSLTMINGELVKDGTFGKVRLGTSGSEQEALFEHMTFTDTLAPTHTGSSSNDTEEMIQIEAKSGGAGKYIFRDCTFNNANVVVSGFNGGAPIEIIFENCTFNNTGNADAIDITSNYATGKVTVRNCTFNLVSTSGVSAVNIWGSKDFDLAFEGANTVNGNVADSSIYTIFSGGASVKAYSVSGSGTHNVTGVDTITVSGIATK